MCLTLGMWHHCKIVWEVQQWTWPRRCIQPWPAQPSNAIIRRILGTFYNISSDQFLKTTSHAVLIFQSSWWIIVSSLEDILVRRAQVLEAWISTYIREIVKKSVLLLIRMDYLICGKLEFIIRKVRLESLSHCCEILQNEDSGWGFSSSSPVSHW